MPSSKTGAGDVPVLTNHKRSDGETQGLVDAVLYAEKPPTESDNVHLFESEK